jgi:hypothetical protein
MIGIAGTIILLPIAIGGLAFGLVRFGARAMYALVAEAAECARHRLALHV